MGQVSDVLRNVQNGFAHWCPGCERMHAISVDAPSGPNWSFEGTVDRPTFNPSVKITYNGPDAGEHRDGGGRAPAACCHYFVRDGQIAFCGDCTHKLAGQTVPLPPLPGGLTD